jgi:hypothetical protein
MKKKTVEVGQTVYSLPIGNAARYSSQVLTPRIVTKVGRKYFYYEQYGNPIKISLEDFCEYAGEYISNVKVYLSEQEWSDEKVATKLLAEVRRKVGMRCTEALTITQLKAILSILEEEDYG